MKEADKWTVGELRELPTLSTGQCCSLKVEELRKRIWVCRGGPCITVERYMGGRWVTTEDHVER